MENIMGVTIALKRGNKRGCNSAYWLPNKNNNYNIYYLFIFKSEKRKMIKHIMGNGRTTEALIL